MGGSRRGARPRQRTMGVASIAFGAGLRGMAVRRVGLLEHVGLSYLPGAAPPRAGVELEALASSAIGRSAGRGRRSDRGGRPLDVLPLVADVRLPGRRDSAESRFPYPSAAIPDLFCHVPCAPNHLVDSARPDGGPAPGAAG